LHDQVEINFLAIAQTYINGKSVYDVLIPPSTNEVGTPIHITLNEDDPRRGTIITSIDSNFFKHISSGETRATIQGIALIKRVSGFTKSESSFYVDLNMISAPSSQPSVIPTNSVPPSASPTYGLSRHVEVLVCQCRINDRTCVPDLLTQFNKETTL